MTTLFDSFFFLINVFSEYWEYSICEMLQILMHVDFIENEFAKEKNSSFKNMLVYMLFLCKLVEMLAFVLKFVIGLSTPTSWNCTSLLLICLWTVKTVKICK